MTDLDDETSSLYANLYSSCDLCDDDFHPPRVNGCPGPLGDDDKRRSWQQKSRSPLYSLADVDALRWGQLPQIPRVHGLSRPRIRFWASDFEGNGLRMVEGTLAVGHVDLAYHHGVAEYTISGNLLPPVLQVLVPDETEEEPQPLLEPLDGAIDAEISMDTEGFQPLGTIDPDALKIETTADYDTFSNGRTVKTREEMTVNFSTSWVNPEVMTRLMRP